jgi:hypothetical protein
VFIKNSGHFIFSSNKKQGIYQINIATKVKNYIPKPSTLQEDVDAIEQIESTNNLVVCGFNQPP